MKYVRLKTLEDFKKHVTGKWAKDIWLWNTFRENTCYVPSEQFFISLDRAKQLNYEEIEQFKK